MGDRKAGHGTRAPRRGRPPECPRRDWPVIVHGAAGLALSLYGIAVIVVGGLTVPLDDPVVVVLGIDHTAAVGMIELGAGLVLLVASSSPELTGIGGGAGVGMLVFGALVVADTDVRVALRTETALGWLFVVAGLVAVAGGLLPAPAPTLGWGMSDRRYG